MGININIPDNPIFSPVPAYDCDASPSYTPEDNLTYINKLEVPVINCPTIPLNDSEDFWNCNLCGSDEKYSQPVIDGDIIYLQIPITNNDYSEYRAYVYDNAGTLIEGANIIDTNIVEDPLGAKYFNIQVTVENVPVDCFYIKMWAFSGEIDGGDVITCVNLKVADGYDPNEAEILCLIEQAEDYTEFYSEIYRRTNDTREDTLLISADYVSYDCQGNYYDDPDGDNEHLLKFRIPATLEKTEFNFEETLVFNRRRSSKQSDTYVLRTEKLPPYVAEMMALAFNAKKFYIDGVEYMRSGKIAKNFEEGRMWIINVPVTRSCDEIDFLCS